MLLFVYGTNAHTNELALFRAERVPTEECETVEVPFGTRELYRLAFNAGGERITDDSAEASTALASGALAGLDTIRVVN